MTFASLMTLAASLALASPNLPETRSEGVFCATGLVVHVMPRTLILQQADGPNLFVRAAGPHVPVLGERVVLSGRIINTRFNEPCRVMSRFTVVGHGAIPPPREVRIADLVERPVINECVTLQAEVEDYFLDEVDARYYYLSLKSGPNRIFGTILRDRTDVSVLDDLLGATVRLTGMILEHRGTRSFSGNRLALKSLTREQVVVPAETDLSKLPSLEGKRFALPSEIASLPRHRIDGTVLAAWHRTQVLVRSADGQVIRATLRTSPRLPSVGESVVVAGYPTTDMSHILLTGGKWQPFESRPAAETPARKMFGNELFTDVHGNHSIESSYHGQAVCIRGKVMRGGARELEIDLGEDTVKAFAGEETGGFGSIDTGSEVELAGIVVLESEIWREGTPFPRVTGVSIVTRRDGDAKVLRRPPWWTPARTLIALCALVALISGLAVWNRILMRLAARRSREVIREQLAKERSELKADERTRLAIELHDSLSQNLSGLGCQLVATRLAIKPGDPAYVRLETAERMLQSTRTELKRCLFDLRGDILEEADFERAIRQTLAPIVGGCRLRIRFHIARSVMDDSLAHAILSIVRELVSNAVRHGHASAVTIAGTLQPAADPARRGTCILVSVRDNGTGFDPESCAGPAEGHFGLTGIRDRINRLGGEFRMKSTRGNTAARLSIPL